MTKCVQADCWEERGGACPDRAGGGAGGEGGQAPTQTSGDPRAGGAGAGAGAPGDLGAGAPCGGGGGATGPAVQAHFVL